MRILHSLIASLAVLISVSAGAQPPLPEIVMPLYKADTVTIRILGDVMMHTRQIETARMKDGAYDFSSYFSLIRDKITSADIAVANMEFTLGGEPYSGYPAFSAPDSYADYLAECGFDIFLAANNHIFDKGSAGAERTLKHYRKLGVKVCGLAEDSTARSMSMPLEMLVKGIRIAFLNATYGTNLGADRHWPKTNYMNEKEFILKALKESEDCDMTIALPHWGVEYRLLHSKVQEEQALMLAENGADAIIGAHPHIPQDFALLTDRQVPVAYSLGNAISNMSAENTQMGLMAELRIVRECSGSIRLLPIRFTYLWCSRPEGYSSSYTVIPVKEFIGRKEMWKGAWEYDKMMSAYRRIQNITGIKDN